MKNEQAFSPRAHAFSVATISVCFCGVGGGLSVRSLPTSVIRQHDSNVGDVHGMFTSVKLVL